MNDLPTISSAYTAALPGDPIAENRCRQVAGAAYSPVAPTPVAAPRTVAYSEEVAALLNLPSGFCASQQFADVMAGNDLLPGMTPYAMCYGGHQFGNWAGQLGDGRAINLGDIVNDVGERWTLQLKGAGPTPYSRNADGRAVLRSSVREFLCSEAMFHLGVPTTRALSLVLTGDEVVRDMFYDGHPAAEQGAVVCRVAPSFIRFGNFEIFAARGELDLLRQLLDFTLTEHFPHLGPPDNDAYLAWFTEVAERTALMVTDWMRVGFVHGVMNTDNMSALGLTIDYGPYGWVDNFDPTWTPNTTDAQGRRYRFGQQPSVALWNLAQLANALVPVIGDPAPLQAIISTWVPAYQTRYDTMQLAKLGLSPSGSEDDSALYASLLEWLAAEETDMTLFYRALAEAPVEALSSADEGGALRIATTFADVHYAEPSVERTRALADWLQRYSARLVAEPPADLRAGRGRQQRMNDVNPKYVLRNYVAQLAIDKADSGDFSLVEDLKEMLRTPYAEQPRFDEYAAKRPDWARTKAGCSMLSCSS